MSPEAARSSIAAALGTTAFSPHLGNIELQPHQIDAVGLAGEAIAAFGGALLCDPVGTGKTFVALAVARCYEHVVVTAPAALRKMWFDAAQRACLRISFVSHEGLSRNAVKHNAPDFVIVDEAHHFRNSSTRRFHVLAEFARCAPMLLLTATPVHNRRQDIVSATALFLGERARSLSDAELGRVVIGRKQITTAVIPRAAPVEWFHTTPDDTVVDALLALPPPAPVRDGGVGAHLIACSLIRQWASSDAALRGGLRRRIQRAAALTSALESGTYPSASELKAWTIGDDAVQLAFAELLAPMSAGCTALLASVRAHTAAIERLYTLIRPATRRDAERAAIVRAIRTRHPGIPTVAFSQYEETVMQLYRALVADGQVAALSGHGGRVAGGTIPRDEVIARFAPNACGAGVASRANAISLLITTDLLSEGFNLQDAGVVIHLDLPWTPARIEQRVGRVARIGSPHELVHSYAFHPPASAEAVVRIERILETKLGSVRDFQSVPGSSERLRATLATWTTGSAPEGVASAVRSACTGFLAAVRSGAQATLVASLDGTVGDDPERLLRAARLAGGEPAAIDATLLHEYLAALMNYLDASAALEGLPQVPTATRSVRSALLRRISQVVRRARPHDRARIGNLGIAARAVISRPSGAFLEKKLEDALRLSLPDDAWLAELASCDHSNTRGEARRDWTIVSIILLVSHGQENALSGATER